MGFDMPPKVIFSLLSFALVFCRKPAISVIFLLSLATLFVKMTNNKVSILLIYIDNIFVTFVTLFSFSYFLCCIL